MSRTAVKCESRPLEPGLPSEPPFIDANLHGLLEYRFAYPAEPSSQDLGPPEMPERFRAGVLSIPIVSFTN